MTNRLVKDRAYRTRGAGWFAPVFIVVAGLFVASCSQSQLISLASKSEGTFISPADEVKIGAQAHPKIVQQFGGVYEDDELAAYITQITEKLKTHSEQPQVPYQVTILNSPAVNAFAVPGGYIYLTRGLLALANDEAEIASVLSHELGHLTQRHSAKRHSVAVKASIITRILQATEDDPELKRNLSLGAAGLLAKHSRNQEFEADKIGIITAAKSGYDPYAAVSFLKTMTEQNVLKKTLAQTNRSIGVLDFFATHPATGLRKIKAFSFVSQLGLKVDKKKRPRNVFLNKINGLRYGSNPDQGIVRGRSFIHPEMKFRFKVPPNFHIQNRKHLVVALDPNRNVMLFDAQTSRSKADLEELLGRHFGLGRAVWKTKRLTINGREAVSGTATYRNADHQIYLIREKPNRIYRFWFISTPDQTEKLSRFFRLTAQSFRTPTPAENKLAIPRKVRTVTVKPGDTVAKLSEKMAFSDFRQQRFRVLNGLSETSSLKVGQLVKIISN